MITECIKIFNKVKRLIIINYKYVKKINMKYENSESERRYFFAIPLTISRWRLLKVLQQN